MSKPKLLWDITSKILETHGNEVDGMSIIEYNDVFEDESVKIYHNEGCCFELKKERICDPDDVSNFGGVNEDGFVYYFSEPWEDFKVVGEDKAIELLNSYAGLNID